MTSPSYWRTTLCLCALAAGLQGATRSTEDLVAWWPFERNDQKQAADKTSAVVDPIEGNFTFVAGVVGDAVRFDGFSSRIVRKAEQAPRVGATFTLEAWIALGAYPWNWCPIISQDEESAPGGYYFGIDSQGRAGLRVAVNGQWVEAKSELDPGTKLGLDLRKWHYLVAVVDGGRRVAAVFVDGQQAASLALSGAVTPAPDKSLFIGRNRKPMTPTNPIREWATYPSPYSFDGIIDEIKIHNRALNDEEIERSYQASRPAAEPDIPPRRFPSVKDSGRFGAFSTSLRYYDEWDALWRSSDDADVVVQFDQSPIQVVFWRGTRYSPAWVTENGKWMADQSREVGENWNVPRPSEEVPTGCCEHMSDAQTRYSRIRVLENHDARVVVHWRYALLDVLYRQAEVDPQTGWGLWGDEIYTIYPDGVAVRHVLPGKGGWQETIFLNEPGTKPEDNVELEAMTLVNLRGESRTYSWENGYPVVDIPDPIVQMTNMRSKYRPFMIFPKGSKVKTFNVEVRPEYSHFPWWNHWPVAQIISDGRNALATDHASHSSLSWGSPNGDAVLYGMTDQPASALLALARSWVDPPTMTTRDQGFTVEKYDAEQRAYLVQCTKPGSRFEARLAASEDSPAVNPAVVIKDWGKTGAVLEIDGKPVEQGKEFRLGRIARVDGVDLVVWMKLEATKPVRLVLEPAIP